MIEKTISVEKIFSGKVIDLYVETVQIDKSKMAIREIVRHRGAVCALTITKEGKLVLIRQFRKAIGDYLFEIPAGKLEAGEAPNEAIRREIREETGYNVEKVDYVTSFYTSPGFSDEKCYVYFAFVGEKGETCFDEDEYIDIFEYSLEHLIQMIFDGEIVDAKTISAVLLYNQGLLRK